MINNRTVFCLFAAPENAFACIIEHTSSHVLQLKLMLLAVLLMQDLQFFGNDIADPAAKTKQWGVVFCCLSSLEQPLIQLPAGVLFKPALRL